jgi:hypothetical protein
MPLGGLNYTDSMLTTPPQDAWMLDNFIARPFGVEVRKGTRYWVPLANSFANEVRSIIPYTAQSGLNSKLFASQALATSILYDITSPNTAPTVSLTPSTPSDVPGEWFYTNFTNPSGGFLCVVAAGAGYYTYTSAGWVEHVNGTSPGQIEFPAGDTTTTKNFCFIWTWKNRIWFLKRDSSVAYYLPINQIAGKVASFDFGAQLEHGGSLNYATGWTYDSGSGMDDGLIIVSSEGDALLYEGTDPASAATFQLKGCWYLGRSPIGRRSYCQHGGNLLFLTEYGISTASDMVAGKLHVSDLSGSTGFKVNPHLSRIVSQYVNFRYWFLLPYPTEELLIVGSPWVNEDIAVRQSFVMNSITNAWSTVSEMDMLCAEVYQGMLIYGTRDGKVIRGLTGYQDGVSADGLVLGSEVTGRLMSSFQDLGSPTMNKRALRVKVYGFIDTQPSIFVIMKDEYKVNDLLSTPAPVLSTLPSWDVAIWDQSLWSSSTSSLRRWIGVTGFGKKLSTQMAVRGSGKVLLTDYELLFEQGIGL